MSEYSEYSKGLDKNLGLIRKYGTKADRHQLCGSGLASNRPLSKTFYKRMKKAGDSFD